MDDHLKFPKRVGIYGGTFDPIHFGHLNLAIEMLERQNLSEIWFCPAQINPHKRENAPTLVQHRLEMVRLAIADIPQSQLIDIEAKKEGASFTFDTVKELVNQHPDIQFYLIMGDDAIPGFFHWHQPEEIVKLVSLLIGSRHPDSYDFKKQMNYPTLVKAIQQGIVKTPLFDISATEIRKRVLRGQYIGHLVPSKVIDYIYQNQLYLNGVQSL